MKTTAVDAAPGGGPAFKKAMEALGAAAEEVDAFGMKGVVVRFRSGAAAYAGFSGRERPPGRAWEDAEADFLAGTASWSVPGREFAWCPVGEFSSLGEFVLKAAASGVLDAPANSRFS